MTHNTLYSFTVNGTSISFLSSKVFTYEVTMWAASYAEAITHASATFDVVLSVLPLPEVLIIDEVSFPATLEAFIAAIQARLDAGHCPMITDGSTRYLVNCFTGGNIHVILTIQDGSDTDITVPVEQLAKATFC